MIAPTLFLILVFIGYCCLINRFNFIWDKLLSHNLPNRPIQYLSVSVIIPARNEGANIENTLNAVLSQSYPHNLFEIIVIDDHSTDQTAQIVNEFNGRVKLIELHQEPELRRSKKQALSVGIREAKNEIIVTLDADCIPVSVNWLKAMVGHLKNNDFNGLTGPVSYKADGSFLQDFQALENAGMMVVTGAGYQSGWFEMANGANMCFKKQAFIEVNGYNGNDELASGDDMFLFEKFGKRYPKGIGFIADKEAIVSTIPMHQFKELIEQRVRWGTKNSRMENPRLKLCLAFVFTVNLLTLLLLLCFAVVSPVLKLMILTLIILKSTMDYRLLQRGSIFLNQENLLKGFLLHTILYPTILVTTGIRSIFITDFTWKGRTVR